MEYRDEYLLKFPSEGLISRLTYLIFFIPNFFLFFLFSNFHKRKVGPIKEYWFLMVLCVILIMFVLFVILELSITI